jgi:hypothetical protein
MNEREERAHAAGASKALKNVNKRIEAALDIKATHTRSPKEDFELNAKRVEYRRKLLDMMNDGARPRRYPRLDKSRNRPVVIP